MLLPSAALRSPNEIRSLRPEECNGDFRRLGNPVLPDVFVPYTLNMVMWTQILVRSDSSPLRLLAEMAPGLLTVAGANFLVWNR